MCCDVLSNTYVCRVTADTIHNTSLMAVPVPQSYSSPDLFVVWCGCVWVGVVWVCMGRCGVGVVWCGVGVYRWVWCGCVWVGVV